MTNNDILRRIRFALDQTDAQMVQIFGTGGLTLTEADVLSYLGREGEADTVECPDSALGAFLDGLILERRGPRQDGSPAPESPERLTNNAVFKKLRIALSMHEKDVLATMAAGGQRLSKGELSALFRNPSHKNFRPCGDQILRSFLGGLTRLRRSPKSSKTSGKKAKGATSNPWENAGPKKRESQVKDGEKKKTKS